MWPNLQVRMWSHLLKKSLMENFFFCAVVPPISIHDERFIVGVHDYIILNSD